MQRKDLTDEVMLDAIRRAKRARELGVIVWPHDLLPTMPAKVVIIEYGVSLRSGWIIAENL